MGRGTHQHASTQFGTGMEKDYIIGMGMGWGCPIPNSPHCHPYIDEAIETTLRIYGCVLIQEIGILLRMYVVIWFLLFFNKNVVGTCNSFISYFSFVYLNLIMLDLKQ